MLQTPQHIYFWDRPGFTFFCDWCSLGRSTRFDVSPMYTRQQAVGSPGLSGPEAPGGPHRGAPPLSIVCIFWRYMKVGKLSMVNQSWFTLGNFAFLYPFPWTATGWENLPRNCMPLAPRRLCWFRAYPTLTFPVPKFVLHVSLGTFVW